jgi:hypothetical protein
MGSSMRAWNGLDVVSGAVTASRTSVRRRDSWPYGRWRVAVLGLAALLLLLLLGCSRGSAAPAKSGGERSQAPPAPDAAAPAATECAVMALERCFATAAEACAAIGCPPERCQFLYSLPMQATCS